LANYLLRDQKGWTTQKIDELLETSTEYYVKLDKGIPVYILYLTSFVDDHGKLNFREDLYNRDPSLQKMLMKN
jgi:murein L,D-transpeptidase YcbB/YkuD